MSDKIKMFKVVKIGRTDKPMRDIYLTIKFKDKKLSITGVEGPRSNGDAYGSCGQIGDSIMEYITFNNFVPADDFPLEKTVKLLDIWDKWHLNDMRPYCEHQKLLGWDKLQINENKSISSYGKHFEGQNQTSWNMLGWVRPEEFPRGLLSKPCPVCGYKYGTAWKFEEVPMDVLEFLESFPHNDVKIGRWFINRDK